MKLRRKTIPFDSHSLLDMAVYTHKMSLKTNVRFPDIDNNYVEYIVQYRDGVKIAL